MSCKSGSITNGNGLIAGLLLCRFSLFCKGDDNAADAMLSCAGCSSTTISDENELLACFREGLTCGNVLVFVIVTADE